MKRIVSVCIRYIISFGIAISKAIEGAVRAAYALFMIIFDYILSVHSESATASWKRWACSAIISGVGFFMWYGIHHDLIKGDQLTDILKNAILAVAGIYGAGAIAASITGSNESEAFSMITKFKNFFGSISIVKSIVSRFNKKAE